PPHTLSTLSLHDALPICPVDTVGLAAFDDVRTVDVERRAMAAVGRRAVNARGDRSDAAVRGRAAQLGQRVVGARVLGGRVVAVEDRKSTRLNSSHRTISY